MATPDPFGGKIAFRKSVILAYICNRWERENRSCSLGDVARNTEMSAAEAQNALYLLINDHMVDRVWVKNVRHMKGVWLYFPFEECNEE